MAFLSRWWTQLNPIGNNNGLYGIDFVKKAW
jgi:hypothetical protein